MALVTVDRWLFNEGAAALRAAIGCRFGIGQVAPFLSIPKTKDGAWEQVLVNALGPVELWAFSTTAEDAELRRRLYFRLSPWEGCHRLAAVFPSGTAHGEIETRKKALMAQGADSDAAAGGVIGGLVSEICLGHQRRYESRGAASDAVGRRQSGGLGCRDFGRTATAQLLTIRRQPSDLQCPHLGNCNREYLCTGRPASPAPVPQSRPSTSRGDAAPAHRVHRMSASRLSAFRMPTRQRKLSPLVVVATMRAPLPIEARQ
jgi:hypothetical protein